MSDRTLKTYIFYCANNIDEARFAESCRMFTKNVVRTISMPCSGKIDIPYLIKALETGADGIVVVTCKKGECRHLEGNLRAHKRTESVESLLGEMGIGSGRVAVVECGKDGVQQVLGEIKHFFDKVKDLPPICAQVSSVN